VIFKRHSHFKAGRVSDEDDERSRQPSESKMTEKYWKYLRTHPRRSSLDNPWTRRHQWDQFWSVPGDFNRKSALPSSCSLTLNKWSKAAPHKRVSWAMREVEWGPNSDHLASLCDFALFPKLTTELKGRHLETAWHPKGTTSCTPQHETTWLPQCFWRVGKNNRNTVYVPKEIILKEVAAKIEEVMPASFFF
jgi:hypothetical protein